MSINNRQNNTSWLARQIERPLRWIIVVAAVVVIAAFAVHDWLGRPEVASLSIESSREIDITPAQVRSIERIGQWEFLAIADEELVDTVRRRLLGSDDKLARIYHGTLRLGIDLSECQDGWLLAHGDTASLTVPRVRLLSEHFIDEARTEAFYESGQWSARDKEQLYQRAARRMRVRSLTPANIRRAEDNATEQLTALMRSFGFRIVEVRFTR